MFRLMKETNLPFIKIGHYKDVDEPHLEQVFINKMRRQLRQQMENRVCARILAWK